VSTVALPVDHNDLRDIDKLPNRALKSIIQQCAWHSRCGAMGDVAFSEGMAGRMALCYCATRQHVKDKNNHQQSNVGMRKKGKVEER